MNEDVTEWYRAFAVEALSREPDYIIDRENQAVIEALCMYFADNVEFLQTKVCKNPSFEKGICLMGSNGSGKTMVMEIFNKLCQARQRPFGMISCEEAVLAFEEGGTPNILRFGNRSFKPAAGRAGVDYSQPIDICFDEFGAEALGHFYKQDVNVMEFVIQQRYKYLFRGMRTHLITNLNPATEIEPRYGKRVNSRFKQMFNQIVLTGKDRRK